MYLPVALGVLFDTGGQVHIAHRALGALRPDPAVLRRLV